MKRVLILNGDSFVGEKVIRQFYAAREYDIEITRAAKDCDEDTTLAFRKRRTGGTRAAAPDAGAAKNSAFSRVKAGGAAAELLLRSSQKSASGKGVASAASTSPLRTRPPSYLEPYVNAVIPAYNERPLDFCACVLENDIIIAVMDEDPTEAECAIKALMNSQYEVEKTFVLVSSALTWANTLVAERAVARQTRRKAREDARRAYWEEMLEEAVADGADDSDDEVVQLRKKLASPDQFARDEDLPPELREPVEDVADDELVPPRVFSEEEYTSRVPHPRFQHCKALEHVVKRANSATLHTYVLFAGLPYGGGEGPLYPYFLSAYQQQQLTSTPALPAGQAGANGDMTLAGSLLAGNAIVSQHVVPMIHVEDLAAIVFKVGSAYDVGESRYMFAVDRGALTVQKILQSIDARLGATGASEALPASSVVVDSAVNQPMMVNYLDAQLPPPPSLETLRAQYENDTMHPLFCGSDLLRCFLLSDIRAEPEAVLSFLPEENWVALEGFSAGIDKVVFQLKKERDLQPCRVLVTGPPMSGSEAVAAALASQYGIPLLTIDSVTAAFEAHTAATRAELVGLLAQRIQRRWDRAHMRRVKEVMAEREEEAARLAEAKAEKKRLKAEDRDARRAAGEAVESSEDDDDDEEEEEEGNNDGGGSEHSSDTAGIGRGGDGAISELSLVFSEDKGHTQRRLAEMLTERYIQGYTEDIEDGDVELADEDDEEHEVDEEQFAQAEEDAAQEEAEQEEEGNAGAVRGRLRALAGIRAADLEERIRIRTLRLRYRLALKAMSMKLVNGALPRPRKSAEDDEADEEEEGEAGAYGSANGGPWGSGSDGENASEDEDHGEDSEGGGGAGSDDGDGADSHSDAAPSAASSAFSAGRRDREVAAAYARSVKGFPTDRRAKGKVMPAHPTVEYLDEAKTFFMRWRLRQPDCRNRGYVMHNFPASVRQACLLFYAAGGADDGADDDTGVEQEPLLPPASVEEVPPPVDAAFPFANLESLSEEQLQELEQDIRHDRVRIVDPHEEGVLAAVLESSFPDHVIVLDDKDETLQALAAAVAADKANRLRAQRDAAALQQKLLLSTSKASDGQDGNASPSSSATVVRKKKNGATTASMSITTTTAAVENKGAQTAGIEDNGMTPLTVGITPGATATEETAPTSEPFPQELLDYVDQLLVTGDAFYKHLNEYRKHHQLPSSSGVAAPPTDSLITWLQSVQTREVVGATPDPVVVHAARKHLTGTSGEPDERGDADASDADEAAAVAPPQTARAAQVDILPAPPRDAVTLRRELLAVLSQSQSIVPLARSESLPRAVWAPNRPNAPVDHHTLGHSKGGTGGGKAKGSSSGLSQVEQPLQWLADKLTRSILPLPPLLRPEESDPCNGIVRGDPLRPTSTASATVPPAAPDAAMSGGEESGGAKVHDEFEELDETEERAVLTQLKRSEHNLHEDQERREEAGMRLERNLLRHTELKEACLDVWPAAQMPKEAYLMKYVIPHLTPAMQEVVRRRPEDPVTVLADLLYNYSSSSRGGASADTL